MNWRNYLYSAVILFTALLLAVLPSSAFADLVTFQVTGHMIDPLPPTVNSGDTFIADYTFDSASQPQHYDSDNPDVFTYDSVKAWHFTFDNGLSISAVEDSPGPIDVWNNLHYNQNPALSDRYSVTLSSPLNKPIIFPGGQTLEYLQVVLDDVRPDVPDDIPDMLTDSMLPLTPPNLALCEYPAGRFVLESNNLYPQIDFYVDSITVVPEPSTAILAIIGFGLLLVLIGVRRA